MCIIWWRIHALCGHRKEAFTDNTHYPKKLKYVIVQTNGGALFFNKSLNSTKPGFCPACLAKTSCRDVVRLVFYTAWSRPSPSFKHVLASFNTIDAVSPTEHYKELRHLFQITLYNPSIPKPHGMSTLTAV